MKCYICNNADHCYMFNKIKFTNSIPYNCNFEQIQNDGSLCDVCWGKYIKQYGSISPSQMCEVCFQKLLDLIND